MFISGCTIYDVDVDILSHRIQVLPHLSSVYISAGGDREIEFINVHGVILVFDDGCQILKCPQCKPEDTIRELKSYT